MALWTMVIKIIGIGDGCLLVTWYRSSAAYPLAWRHSKRCHSHSIDAGNKVQRGTMVFTADRNLVVLRQQLILAYKDASKYGRERYMDWLIFRLLEWA